MARCESTRWLARAPLKPSGWSKRNGLTLGLGPALISAFGAELLLAICRLEPDAAAIGFLVRYDHPPLPIMSSSRLWARACPGGRPRAIVAPLDLLGLGRKSGVS